MARMEIDCGVCGRTVRARRFCNRVHERGAGAALPLCSSCECPDHGTDHIIHDVELGAPVGGGGGDSGADGDGDGDGDDDQIPEWLARDIPSPEVDHEAIREAIERGDAPVLAGGNSLDTETTDDDPGAGGGHDREADGDESDS